MRRRVPLIRLSYFAWVIPAALLYGAAQLVGEPHVIWSYTYRSDGRAPSLYGPLDYTSCTYLGWSGVIVEPAEQGRCGWVRFGRSDPR